MDRTREVLRWLGVLQGHPDWAARLPSAAHTGPGHIQDKVGHRVHRAAAQVRDNSRRRGPLADILGNRRSPEADILMADIHRQWADIRLDSRNVADTPEEHRDGVHCCRAVQDTARGAAERRRSQDIPAGIHLAVHIQGRALAEVDRQRQWPETAREDCAVRE